MFALADLQLVNCILRWNTTVHWQGEFAYRMYMFRAFQIPLEFWITIRCRWNVIGVSYKSEQNWNAGSVGEHENHGTLVIRGQCFFFCVSFSFYFCFLCYERRVYIETSWLLNTLHILKGLRVVSRNGIFKTVFISRTYYRLEQLSLKYHINLWSYWLVYRPFNNYHY